MERRCDENNASLVREPGEPLLGQPFKGLGKRREVRSVLWVEEPTLNKDVFHLPARLQVCKGRSDPFTHLPNDCLRWLLLPRPLPGEKLVPNRPKCIDVAGPGEMQVFRLLLVNLELADHLR